MLVLGVGGAESGLCVCVGEDGDEKEAVERAWLLQRLQHKAKDKRVFVMERREEAGETTAI